MAVIKKTDFGDQHSQADVGTSENTRSSIVINESDEEDKVYFRSICVSFLNLLLRGLDGR